MSSKQSDNRNRITVRRLCIYAIFAALCMMLGYIESMLPFDFIAPGIKLGLANSVALILVLKDDIKGAFAVNITRILLTSLLFGSAASLAFSLTAGVVSLAVTALIVKTKKFGAIAVSAAAGAVHNLTQLGVAAVVVGGGVIYYLPVLIAAGALGGAAIGFLAAAIFKKIETNGLF